MDDDLRPLRSIRSVLDLAREPLTLSHLGDRLYRMTGGRLDLPDAAVREALASLRLAAMVEVTADGRWRSTGRAMPSWLDLDGAFAAGQRERAAAAEAARWRPGQI